jgi:pimeloyl-ACP methyl ester carboxylesterase
LVKDEQHNLRADGRRGGGGCFLLAFLALGCFAAALGSAWFGLGLSLWSAVLALGIGSLALGSLLAAWRNGAALRVAGAGVLLVVGPWLWRALTTREHEGVRLTTLPADRGARLVSTLYPESDGAIAAARFVQALGGLRDEEAGQFYEILAQAYARATPSAASLATPAIPTYLGLETPEAFDTIVIDPSGTKKKPDAAVIFLHGYAGNFYVYCWELAQAAADANLITLCPSVDASGAWWTPRGAQTFRATLDYAHGLGARRVYLAGLSNGAAGASVLALEHQQDLSGLILISGTRAETPPSLPVLVVQGKTDQMMPAPYARAYAAKGPRVQYYEVPGGHLVLLSRYQMVRPVIAGFLRSLERGR